MKKTNSDVADDIFHTSGDCSAEEKQQNRVLFDRLHGIDTERTDPIDRQPWAIQDPTVTKHSLRIPVEHLLVDPSRQAADEKNQK